MVTFSVCKTKSNLTKHIHSLHNEIKYPSDQCDTSTRSEVTCSVSPCKSKGSTSTWAMNVKKSISKGYLKTHIQSVHKRVKYSCIQCGKPLTQQGDLEKS